MNSWITTPQVTKLLDALYVDAAQNDSPSREERRKISESGARGNSEVDYFGHLLYSLVRSSKARTVVEFGTSFGVSTIYLASAIRDNGAGKVITTEFEPEKLEQAKKNLAAAGLDNYVEFRFGDALQTLANPPSAIDMVFLDGAKTLYLPVLKLLEPSLLSGAIIASDNTNHDGLTSFLAYIRDKLNGYTSSAILTEGTNGKPHEITIRH